MGGDVIALCVTAITAIGGFLALRAKADDKKVDRLEASNARIIDDLNRHIQRLENRVDELEEQNGLLLSKLMEMGCSVSSIGLTKPKEKGPRAEE